MSDQNSALVLTPEVRFLFPQLFEKKEVKDRSGRPTGKEVYSIALLLEPGQEKGPLTQALLQAAKAKWPNRDVVADIKAGKIRWPILSGEKEKAKAEEKGKNGDFYEGKKVIKAASIFDVGVVGPNKQDIINAKEVYSGCYGYVELKAEAYNAVMEGTPDGLKFYLQNVMKSRDGERLTGRTAADAFAGVQAQETTEDLDAGAGDLDDEIPF